MSTLNLSNAITNTYALIDKDHKYFVASWHDDGNFRKNLTLYSIHEGQEKYMGHAQYTVDQVLAHRKILKDIAPIDIRIFKDDVEIVNDEDKAQILESLTIFEHRIETKSALRSMTDQTAKLAKEESVLRTQIANMVNSMSANVSGLSLNKCKKLKAALKEIHN